MPTYLHTVGTVCTAGNLLSVIIFLKLNLDPDPHGIQLLDRAGIKKRIRLPHLWTGPVRLQFAHINGLEISGLAELHVDIDAVEVEPALEMSR